jgi:hypothetical protein
MKYDRPIIKALASLASAWCEVGSNGENADNSCLKGNAPSTVNCKTGSANQSGHCMSGTSVGNQGAACECATGTGGSSGNGCGAGSKATGSPGCHVGTQACHCVNGTSA